MMKDFEQLSHGWIAGTLTEAEVNEFLQQLETDHPGIPVTIDGLLEDPLVAGMGDDELREKLYSRLAAMRHAHVARVKVRKLFSRSMKWAAAILLVVASVIVARYFTQADKQPANLVDNGYGEPLMPGGDRAVLVLSDGSRILLDSTANGRLAAQSGAVIYKSDGGQITYEKSVHPLQEQLTFNTLTTPRGGQYKLTLPDGTKVWLNAVSSITYPTAFTGNERNVSITGEAYFEVAKVPVKHGSGNMPFKVTVNETTNDRKMEVTVLGTHFNINAYTDEPVAKTTLLEGSVKVKKNNDQYLLQPGQQALIEKGADIRILTEIDADEVLAWKNGFFNFRHADLQTLMRQIARWYDVSVEYRGAIPHMSFGGEIPRKNNAEEVLKILEGAGLHFKVEGKTIIVTPQ